MATRNCDIAIVYRIHPKVSKTPLVFADDKYRLAETCLRSLKAGLNGLEVKIWALLDNCPPRYQKLFESLFSPEELVCESLPGVGNTGTFARQIEILCTQTDSELVYFAEDDYFYLPDRLVELVGLMRENQEIDFVSPYDHLDYYTLAFHQHPVKVRATAQRHWRQANSTCMTFMTRRQVLQKTRPLFMSYINGNYDVSIWMALTKMRAFDFMFFLHCGLTDRLLRTAYAKAWWYGWRQLLCGRRYQLWTPIPSIATHMESTAIAPIIDWKTEISKLQRQIKKDRN